MEGIRYLLLMTNKRRVQISLDDFIKSVISECWPLLLFYCQLFFSLHLTKKSLAKVKL